MKRQGNTALFYNCRWLLGFYLLVMLEFIVFFAHTAASAPFLYTLFGVGIGGIAFYVLGTNFLMTKAPLIEITDREIRSPNQTSLWTEVRQVTLSHPLMEKTWVPRLKIDCKHASYSVRLRFMSDKERRLLLDEVEKHIPVHYKRCRYSGHYTCIEFGVILFLVSLVHFVLVF